MKRTATAEAKENSGTKPGEGKKGCSTTNTKLHYYVEEKGS